MFGHKHYVPILKGKEGEFRALSTLAPVSKRILTPLIDIPRRDINPDTQQPNKLLESYLSKKANRIYSCWGSTRPIFVDLFDLALDLRMKNGDHFISYMFEHLRQNNVQAIPTTGLDRDDQYQIAIRDVISKDGRGGCIRLLAEDIEDPATTVRDLSDLLQFIRITQEGVHLILYFRSLPDGSEHRAADLTIDFMGTLPFVDALNTISVAASGFPENLAKINPYSIYRIPRTEWRLRQILISQRNRLPRLPAYGDYGICHPDILDFDPRIHTPSAAIRYTTDLNWIILKAGSLKRYGFHQFHQLAGSLIGNPEYSGAHYSWGDEFIDDCANNMAGTGNLTTWRQVGTSHHLTLVGEQISNSSVI